jgi:hypothetical protein
MAVFESTPPNDEDSSPENRWDQIWNLLTALVLAAMLVVIVIFYLIYRYPSISINPYPPATLPAALVLPSSTPTLPSMPPTWTPTPTITLAASSTPVPPTVTPTVLGSDLSLTPSVTPQYNALYAFALEGDPAAVSASIFAQNRDQCNWMGVGGRVVDLQKRPVTGILVQLGGTVRGKVYNQTSLTGTATGYGESGYEFTLTGLKPFASKGLLWVQLMDQQGIPLSPEIHFDTLDDCSKNLVMVNFKQVR